MINIKRITALAVATMLSAFFAGCAQNGGDSSSQQPDEKPDTSTAEDSEKRQPEPEEISEMFDVEPIIKAYHSGDSSGLSELETAILDKASQVYSEVISDDMSNFEKELALHDYLISNCTYDSGALRAIPEPSENSDNPYGALVNGQAICKGYTTTFSLFMGMAEIPCIIIHSEDTDGDEHAWNAVQLDGDWYYVDSTWDDPVPDFDGRLVEHTYFNVSKEFMLERHVLSDADPDTASEKYSYFNQQAVEINSLDELRGVIEAAFKRGSDSAEVIFTDPSVTNGVLEIEGSYAFAGSGSELERLLNDVKGDRKMAMRIPVVQTERGTVYSFEYTEFAW